MRLRFGTSGGRWSCSSFWTLTTSPSRCPACRKTGWTRRFQIRIEHCWECCSKTRVWRSEVISVFVTSYLWILVCPMVTVTRRAALRASSGRSLPSHRVQDSTLMYPYLPLILWRLVVHAFPSLIVFDFPFLPATTMCILVLTVSPIPLLIIVSAWACFVKFDSDLSAKGMVYEA